MLDMGLLSDTKSLKSAILNFRIPYFTQWGQSLLVCGSEPVLGSWNVKKGVLLSPTHEGDDLIWSGSLTVPAGVDYEYSYYVVNDNRIVLRWEGGKKRKLVIPNEVQDGEVLELHDLWQAGSESIPFRSAFKNVIFGKNLSVNTEVTPGIIQNKLDGKDGIIVQFKICCPNIEKETAVYVIGSSLKLGRWKVQDGLKLNYAGESLWQADCVMQKDDFPIKYKYSKYGKEGNFSLETGPNRELLIDFSTKQAKYIVLSDGMMREMPWRGAGVAVPRNPNSSLTCHLYVYLFSLNITTFLWFPSFLRSISTISDLGFNTNQAQMPRNNHGLIHDSCKIRKRGCSSSSSTSSKLHNYRFKRAILVGNKTRREVGSRSSTPVPTWKTTSSSALLMRAAGGGGAVVDSPKYDSSKSRPVSARKLAATLWEMNEMPKLFCEEKKLNKNNKVRSVISTLLPPHLSDPAHTPLSQRTDRPLASSNLRRTPSISQRHRLAEETVGHVDSLSSTSLMEIDNRSQAQTPSGPAVGARTRLKEVSNALSTARELLKIVVRIWSHNDTPTSSASLVTALHAELERARLQVNRVMKEQQSEQNEINYIVKCFAKEKALWKNKQQQAVEAAIESIAGELDLERKLRHRFESLNKKLGRELADTKSSLLKTVKELDSEKRAREIMEQVCDELASDIGEDRAVVEVLKRESAKAHEEVEREREMLQLADKLREQRVQMKLSEAKHQFEEKNAVVDKLRNQLEAFLKPKKTKKKGTRPLTPGTNDEIPTYLIRTDFDLDQNDEKEDNRKVENEVDTDVDSGESDLHSIELSMDNNNKSFKWNHSSAVAHDSRRVSVDDKLRGRSSISAEVPRKITSIQRSVSDGVEWGSHTKNTKKSGDALDHDRLLELEKQTHRKGLGDELQRYKTVKGLRDQVLSNSRTGSAGDFPSPVRQNAQTRPPKDPVHLVEEKLHAVQGSGSKSRLVEAKGEGQVIRRSRR